MATSAQRRLTSEDGRCGELEVDFATLRPRDRRAAHARHQSGNTLDFDAYPWAVDGSAERQLALGIDFGGTGIKAALVDATTGELISNRIRMTTPRPSTPEAVGATIVKLVANVTKEHAIPEGTPIGLGLPGVVKNGVTLTAANIDKAWIGASAEEVVGTALGRRVYAMNDADAAGLAEVRLGAGRGVPGTVLMLTVGTGIGSGLFSTASSCRTRSSATSKSMAATRRRACPARRANGAGCAGRRGRLEFNEYLARVEAYLWPDLIILGGGVSKVVDKYDGMLKSRAPVEVAQYRNTSGIIGAALHAAERTREDAMRSFSESSRGGKHSRGGTRTSRPRRRRIHARPPRPPRPSKRKRLEPRLAGPPSRRDVRALSLALRATATGARSSGASDQRYGRRDRVDALPVSRRGSHPPRLCRGSRHRVVAQLALAGLQDELRRAARAARPVHAGGGRAACARRRRLAVGRVRGGRRTGHGRGALGRRASPSIAS